MGSSITQKLTPSGTLAPYIKYYLYLETDHVGKFRMVSIPDIEMYFVFRPCKVVTRHCTFFLPKVFLGGIQDLYYDDFSYMYSSEEKKGFVVVFYPSAVYQLFGFKLGELANFIVHADELMGAGIYDVWEKLKQLSDPQLMKQAADQYFSSFLPARYRHDPLTDRAIGLINSQQGMIRQQHICEQLCVTPRKLQRLFRENMGCTAKELLQIYRFNFVLREINHFSYSQLTQLSYLCDYFDQSHFIKDFKRVTGQRPKVFVASEEKKPLYTIDNRKFFTSDN